VVLLETARPEVVKAVQHRLGKSAIPYRSGLLAAQPPRVLISVPRDRLDEARAALGALARVLVEPDEDEDEDEEDDDGSEPEPPARFPRRDVLAVALVVAFHLALVVGAEALLDSPRRALSLGGLIAGRTHAEPWRLLTAMFLHVDVSHALWNGASMLVFAVPLLHHLGGLRTGAIYLAAGLGGGLAAVSFAGPGTVIVGSSGAVAGLFGAWIVIALRQARRRERSWRTRIRTLGVAALVLPSLLSPVSSSGHRISVSAHLGGMLTGMLIGALIGSRLLAQLRERLREPLA
jgi:membrane associated rhomboid family serine protease